MEGRQIHSQELPERAELVRPSSAREGTLPHQNGAGRSTQLPSLGSPSTGTEPLAAVPPGPFTLEAAIERLSGESVARFPDNGDPIGLFDMAPLKYLIESEARRARVSVPAWVRTVLDRDAGWLDYCAVTWVKVEKVCAVVGVSPLSLYPDFYRGMNRVKA